MFPEEGPGCILTVVTEVVVVDISGGVCGQHQVVVTGGEMGIRSSSPSAPSSSSPFHLCFLVRFGGTPAGLDCCGGMVSKRQESPYISILEVKALMSALNAYLQRIIAESAFLMSDSSTAVAYLRSGVTVSVDKCKVAQEVVEWSKLNMVIVMVRYIRVKKNILADRLNHPDQFLLTEWYFLLGGFDAICEVYGRPFIDLFTTRANAKLPLYVSTVPGPMAWKQDAFQRQWNNLSVYTFPPFPLLR